MGVRFALLVGLACGALVGAGCDGCAPLSPDAGVGIADSGGRPLADAAGHDDDGGDPYDAGRDEDAGAHDDAGALDGGALEDGGALDAGRDDDGGALNDAGSPDDGGGAQGDGGGGTDAGPIDGGRDAGERADAGASDAGPAAGLPCPSAGLAVRLTWDTVGDLDLHLSLDDAAWCSDEDCWWGNCAPDASLPLVDWDGVGGESAGDPRLLVDDNDGFGPEVVCIEEPFVAAYVVGVRYETFSGWPAGEARVEVFSGGELVAEVELSGFGPSEFWQPGRVVVSSSAVSFVDEARRCEANDGWLCQDEPGDCPALP